MIVATVVLSAAFLFQDEMSDAQIIQRALELGMVMEEDTPKTLADFSKQDNADKADPDSGTDDDSQSGNDPQNDGKTDTDNPDKEDNSGKEPDGSQQQQDDKQDGQTDTNEKNDPPEKNNGEKGENKGDNKPADPPEQQPPQQDNGNKVTVTIVGGDVSRTVSAKVFEAGLVESADEFNAFLGSNNYDNQLQPGTYEITKGASFEEIARILTTR